MRSFILILITLAVLGFGFGVYFWLQPEVAKHSTSGFSSGQRKERPPATQSLRGLSAGDSVWVKRYDHKTGELKSQFIATKYEPQKDGTVYVVKPKSEFFSEDGKQRIRIEGSTGNVQMDLPPEDKSGKMQSRMETTAPKWGKLQDVTVSLFEPADDETPNLIATMNNASFDNDKFRIATEAYTDEKGNRIEADQVPVIVRGRDYDFDGKGLVIRWNERDQKLQLLEVAHGESLKVKNLSAVSQPMFGPAEKASTKPAARATDDITSYMLASADPRALVRPVAQSSKKRPTPAAKKRPPTRPAPPPTTRPKIVRDLSPVVYHAIFERDVRIFEGDQQIVQAGQMTIDMLQSNGSHGASSRPAEDAMEADDSIDTGVPATRSDKRERHRVPTTDGAASTTAPISQATTAQLASEDAAASSATMPTSQATSKPTSQATSRPAQAPILVKWSGKLTVVPVDGPRDPALEPGKAKVRMTGSPVVLTRDGTEAQCGEVTYNTANQSASLLASKDVPVVTLSDARGSKVTTPRLDYVVDDSGEQQKIATLVGASWAEFPVEGNGGTTRAVASWNDHCTLLLAEAVPGKVAIEHADLVGAVQVDHPQLKMSSQTLALSFDPARATTNPTTKPTTAPADNPSATLKQIDASGDVKCVITDAQQKKQTIDAQKLRVVADAAPDGRTYAKHFEAEGNVHTTQEGKSLDAGSLVAELAPTTRPAATQAAATQAAATQAADATQPVVQAIAATRPASTTRASTRPVDLFGGGDVKLVSLVARDNVRLTTAEGGSATADRLTVQPREGGPQGTVEEYRLIGKPTATLTDGKTTIVGPAIRMVPDLKIAEILGPGTLDGHDPADPKKSVNIAWSGGAVINGATDWIDVTDHVVVQSTQDDGTVSGATSDKLRAKLAPKAPSTAPSTAPATQLAVQLTAATSPSSRPSTKPAAGDEMNFMSGKDIVATTMTGHVEVKSELKAPDGTLARGLNLFAETVNYDRLTETMLVPVEGNMLYQDHRPASTQPAEGPTVGSGRGATAFEWKKSLLYSQHDQQATLLGDVRIVHHPDAATGQPFNLSAQTVTAFFEPDPSAATKPASTSPSNATTASGKFRLKGLTAREDVKVTSSRLNVDAKELTYDPIRLLLNAIGDEAAPVTVFDNLSGSTQTASELEWNTKTDQFKITKLGTKVRR